MIQDAARRALGLAILLLAISAGCDTPRAAAGAKGIDQDRRSQHVESFDQVWQTIHDQHYDRTFGGIDWNAVRTELRPRMEAVTSDQEAETILADLVGRLKLSHFAVVGPNHAPSAERSEFIPSIAADAPATPVKFGNLPEMPLRVFQTKLPQQDVTYFYLSIFLSPPQVMPAYRKAIADARSTAGLIIDLRHNPGGVGIMAMGMGNALINQPDLKLGTMIQRDGELNFVLNPQPEPYTGPVAILIDQRTGSTAEIFAQGMQDIGRARIFGTRSAGQALPSMVTRLPNGCIFQYAVANYISTSGKTLEGHGVTPDEPVDNPLPGDPTDPVIEAAVRWIQSQAEKKQ